MNNRYEKEIADYCAERALLFDESHAKKCERCEDVSVFVEPFDITYRNHGTEKECFMDLCVYCKYEIIEQMDYLWSEYYASIR